eukprot:GHVU01174773.1.p1 GENE.GHVU01174773.1~~GHVU01174773.1.p1  ORF type:complete len:183 (+),score=1.40 GHVU01174773.1:303-851(+)
MDYATQLLKTQFNCKYGMFTPSYLYSLASASDHTRCPKVPRDHDALQIHYIAGHYILSAKKGNTIFLYDSLPHLSHESNVLPQLHILYEGHTDFSLQCLTPQFQGSTSLCGIFAIASAVCILNNDDPCSKHFVPDKMRSHLKTCLINGIINPFPCATPAKKLSVHKLILFSCWLLIFNLNLH